MMNAVKVNFVALGATVIVVLILLARVYYKSRLIKTTVNLKELLSVSIELAERGGIETVEVKKLHKLHAESKGKTKEGAKEMKTDGDMRSHRAILSGFHKAFPSIANRIVSEEHDKSSKVVDSAMASKSRSDVGSLADEHVDIHDITIWVDPLDATQEYTEDLDQYVTVMICVAVKGQPVIGVIHKPGGQKAGSKETVWGWVGKGVSANLEAVKNDAARPASPTVIISRSHTGTAKEMVTKAFGKGDVIPAGGAGYKTIEVIRGKADVYAHVTLIKKWDICAGNALLNAVGGQMRTLQDETINYDKSGKAVNEHGLLASMSNSQYYMNKLGPVFADARKH